MTKTRKQACHQKIIILIFLAAGYFLLAYFFDLPTIPYFAIARTHPCEVDVEVLSDSTVLLFPSPDKADVIRLSLADYEELKRDQYPTEEKYAGNITLHDHLSFLPKETPWMKKALIDHNSMFNPLEEKPPKFKKRPRGKVKASLNEVACRLKQSAPIQFVQPDESPFHELRYGKYIPKESYISKRTATLYKTCALVTSSGALRDSRLGQEIDSHDAVLRFNVAPIKGFENDVGSKTTIRIANNQVIRSYRFKLLEELKGSEIILTWREGPYNGNMYKWYKDGQNFFCSYARWHYKHPESPVYVIRLETLWKVWDIIQEFSVEELKPFPSTSGFLGVHLLLHICDEVDVYGYIPSSDKDRYCYYYEDCCFFCGWNLFPQHPFATERNLVLKMNTRNIESSRDKIKVTLQGYSKFKCEDN
ncbi:beta-galactoside alpha-2,6-sialyltransferase 1-like [Glandiceps talaboti]